MTDIDTSVIRLQTSSVWSVDENGEPVECLETTAPRYTNVAKGESYGDWSVVLQSLGAEVPSEAQVENDRLRAVLQEHGIEVPSDLHAEVSEELGTNESVG